MSGQIISKLGNLWGKLEDESPTIEQRKLMINEFTRLMITEFARIYHEAKVLIQI